MSVQDSKPIRLMVVDDHTLFRRGLTALLRADGRFEVVAEAGDAAEALRQAPQALPQLILLDNHLPGVSGVDALPSLLASVPGVRVLMLTMSEDEEDLAAALRGGASGYLLKTADNDQLAAAIERVMRGQTSISPELADKMAAAFRNSSAPEAPAVADPLATLSPREREILEHIAAGASNKEIARSLSIAETTVKIHVQHILRKLNLSSRVQAAVLIAERRN